MPDIKFKVIGVKKTKLNFARKGAVFWPLQRKKAMSDVDTIKLYEIIMRRWRKQLLALYNVGWKRIIKSPGLQFARNCPPDIVLCDIVHKLKCCKLSNICPWCYSRRIQIPYDTISEYLPSIKHPIHPLFKLVEISNSTTRRFDDVGELVNIDRFVEFQRTAKFILKRMCSEGYFYTTYFVPQKINNTYIAWKFKYSILAKVDYRWTAPDWLIEHGRKVRITTMESKRQLVPILARTYRYPASMLYADPNLVAYALESMSRVKVSSIGGCFRKKRKQEEE